MAVGQSTIYEKGILVADRFRVQRMLGSGSMGLVLLVLDEKENDRKAVLKIVSPDTFDNDAFLDSFKNEGSVSQNLKHPNIVSAYCAGVTDRGHYYLGMEYVDGGTLQEHRSKVWNGVPPFYISVFMLLQIARAISHAHNNGVLHLDLKPTNILLDSDGTAKLTDFGIARLLHQDTMATSATGEPAGTPAYMSPEQFRGDPLDAGSDIYSFGIMAYELVMGRPPFEDRTWQAYAYQHMTFPIPSFSGNGTGIPKWYERFVKRCCAKKRKKRFKSADEIVAFLSHHIVKAGSSATESAGKYGVELENVEGIRKKYRRKQLFRRIQTAAFGVAFLVAVTGVVRSGDTLHDDIHAQVLKLESNTSWDLRSLKKLFGFSVVYNGLEFFLKRDENTFWHYLRGGNNEAVRLLLLSGLDPNVLRNHEGYSALRVAVLSGNVLAAKCLIEAGADLNERDEHGETPLMIAAKAEHGDVFSMILATMFEKGMWIDETDFRGRTALTHAVIAKELRYTRELLLKRAAVNKIDEKQVSILMHAVLSGEEEIVKATLDAGADVMHKSKNGKTAADLAMSLKRKDLYQLIMAKAQNLVDSRAEAPETK